MSFPYPCHPCHPWLTLKLTTVLGCAALAAGCVALASAQTNSYPFQDPNLPLEERVNNVVSLMTLDEKVAFFSSRPGVPRLGIRAMGHVEGLHGLARGGPSNWGRRNPVPTTIFPQAYGLGETWDPEILR
jgi:beta-glucosidase